MTKAILRDLLAETRLITKLLPPVQVVQFFSNLAESDNRFTRRELGKDTSGRNIYAYSFGKGSYNCLFYAFPDPGEVVGGSGIIALANLLKSGVPALNDMPVTWHFVPCLNFIDQPDHGESLQHVLKSKSQEVDWCLNNPRPETTALLNFSKEIKPAFTFALHDEAHSGEDLPAYLGVTQPLSNEAVCLIRSTFAGLNIKFNADFNDAKMGEGFFLMSSIGKEFYNSTFSQLAEYGQVLIADVAMNSGLNAADIVFIQMSAGLIALNEAITTLRTNPVV